MTTRKINIANYLKFVPHLYFIVIIGYWFLEIVTRAGWTAFIVLALIIPFIWQLIRPNRKLNLALGILFMCLSSYLILAYLSDVFDIQTLTDKAKTFLVVGGLFVLSNFFMAMWILRNSLKQTV